METVFLPSNTNQKEQDTFRTISISAVVVGTLDIAAANIQYYLSTDRGTDLKLTGTAEPITFFTYLTHGGPDRIFTYISTAVFNPSTSERLLVAWGAVLHYFIAFLFTVVLFLIYPKVHRLLKNKLLTGFVYGLFVWSIMNLLVIPLSKINKFPSDFKLAVTAELILTFMIGVPVVLIAHRFYSRRGTI